MTPDPITITVAVTLVPEDLRHLDGGEIVFRLNDGATGVFFLVARRPRSTSPWVHPSGTRHSVLLVDGPA
ncbi:hypothetical protein [Gordonia sp. MP11Mi]|uniref:hypothetical protein n=1 Tax=Gordonia sp. MP11Mi TaxID=3022769 RepID=UPI003B227C6D